MYSYQVNFEKVFVDGILAGRRYHDWLRFADWQSADRFCKREGEQFKAISGTGNYRMECPILSAIEPTGTNSKTANPFPNCPELA
jgi:hypothetical protein